MTENEQTELQIVRKAISDIEAKLGTCDKGPALKELVRLLKIEKAVEAGIPAELREQWLEKQMTRKKRNST